MKKILFLLLLSVAMYGQVPADATPLENIQITNNIQDNTATKVTVQDDDGVQNWLPMANLPVSTATTNALDLKTTLSAGAFSGFAVTNNGDGTISVGSGIAYLRATNDQYAPLIKYPIAAYNNIPLVDNLNNYIVVSYNGGSPALVLNTTGTGIDTQTTSIAIAAARVGTTVHYVSLVGSNSDPNAKLRNRYLQSEGIRRVSGLAISATGRKIATTAGITYSGLIRLDVAAMNTNVSDTYTLAYNNGSTWTRVTGQTDINNTQYNNAGTLTALSNNNFRTDYIYALVNSPSKLFVILGNTQYNTIGAARLAPTPSSLPVELEQLGVLVGRAIIEKDAVTIEMASPFVQDFAAGAIENHNDLAGLQGGTAGEYNHLTDAQVALVNTIDEKTHLLNTISELEAYTGNSKNIFVLEENRGGEFRFVSSGLTPDNGVVFNHAISGYWIRVLNGFVLPEYWGTGTTTSHSFIQSALNYAAGKNIKVKMLPKQYNIDDILIIKSNTELELDKATIIRLNDNVNKSMLRNFGAVYAGSTALIDSNITVSGGTWEGNGANQTLYSAEPSLNVGLEFHNIENVRLKDTKINLTRSYATYFSSAKNIYIDRVNIDNGDVKDLNRDGLHFNGPTDNVIINDCILRGTDDQLAFNANDIDYAYKVNAGGDITNTIINNVIFDNTYKGIRLLSAANNITRMTINNLSGTTSGNIIECGNYELGTGGKIDDVIINNLNFNVNQTVNDGRVLFHFRKGGYGKIVMDNIKVGGNHFVNPTFEFLNGVDMDYFKISNLTSFGTDTGAYADFKIRQGEATFPTIDTFIIDGYNFTSSVAKANKLIDIDALTVGDFQLLNSNIDNAESIIYTDGGSVFGKITLGNNIATNNTNGIDFTNTTVGKLNIYGDFIKSSGGYAFSKASTSTITETKVNPYVSNTNSDVSTNYYVPYLNNGIAKNLTFSNTLTEVLTKGATSTLGASIGNIILTGSSDTNTSLRFGNTNFGWGFLERVTDGNLDLSRYMSGVRTSAMLFNRSNGQVTFSSAAFAPTAPVGTNTTQIATMAAVQTAITNNGVITTATNITNATLTDTSLPQNGKTLYISNGANNINYTVNGSITASFVKGGTGSITFVQGSGRTMVAANGTLVFNGAQYSTASVVSFGTTDIVYINNF